MTTQQQRIARAKGYDSYLHTVCESDCYPVLPSKVLQKCSEVAGLALDVPFNENREVALEALRRADMIARRHNTGADNLSLYL